MRVLPVGLVSLVVACGGESHSTNLGSGRPDGSVADRDAGRAPEALAPSPSPQPTELPPPGTPCVPSASGASPAAPSSDAAEHCWSCSCERDVATSGAAHFTWDCETHDCPDTCRGVGDPPGASALCEVDYPTTCNVETDRCTGTCTCPAQPPKIPGFTPLAYYWSCRYECVGCPPVAPAEGADCWGEPDACTYGSDCSTAVTCVCDVITGEDVFFLRGQWRCTPGCADAGSG